MTVELVASPYVDYDEALRVISRPQDRDALIRTLTSAVQRLDSGDVHIVLLAARRMACFYALLRSCGLPKPRRGEIRSDRLIGLLPRDKWRGKRLLYVDDTRISGKTESQGRQAAQRLVGDTGEVEYDSAIRLDGPEAELTSRRLHREFALAFGKHLTPYFTDFPVTAKVTVGTRAFEELLLSPRWLAVDVTNSAIAGSGSRAYSLALTDPTLASFRASLGAASQLVEIAKIRIFSRQVGDRVEFRAVPLVLACALSRTGVESWLSRAKITQEEGADQGPQAAGAVSFLLSRALGEAFSKVVADDFGIQMAEDPELADLATGALRPELTAASSVRTLHDLVGEIGSDQRDTTAFMTSASDDFFGHRPRYIVLGDDAVLPTYRHLYAADSRVRAPRGTSTWAKEALTLAKIAHAQNLSELVVSLSIDVMNDLGVMVPQHRLIDGEFQRCYRSGEARLDEFFSIQPGTLGGVLASVPVTLRYNTEELT